MARVVVFPYVTDPKATLGFQPYYAYSADPVNVATGSFTNANTDLVAPSGVYGLDWTRTYNSANSASSSLGVGWSPSFSSAILTQGTSGIVRYDNGRQVTYTSSGGVFVAPVGEANSLTHNLDSTWTVTFPTGEHWNYDATGRLMSRTSADGHNVTVTYSTTIPTQVTAVTAHNAAGTVDGGLTFTYDSTSNMLTGATTADGRSVSYTVTGNALVQVVDANSKTWTYTVDTFGRILSETDPTGSVIVTNTFDDNGRVLTQTSSSGDLTTFGYDATTGTTTVTDGTTNQTLTYVVGTDGKVLSVKDPTGNSVTRKYTSGYPTTATDRSGVTQNATYDSVGNLTSLRDPSQTNTSNASDPTAGITSYTYDSLSRMLTETDPTGLLTTYAYTGARTQPDTVTVTSGATVEALTTYSYDTSGRVTKMVDPDGIITTYTGYNNAGQPATITTGGAATTYTYFSDGNIETMKDPAGNETDYTYDGAGDQLTVTGPYAAGDVNPIVTTNTYDAAGRLSTVTGPAYTNDATKPLVTYTYNLTTGQLATKQGPLPGDTTTYVYDNNGNTKTVTDPQGVTTNTWGTLGRLTSVQDPAGLVTGYGYDANGDRVSTASPNGETTQTVKNTSGQVTSTVVKPTSTTDPTPARTSTSTYDTYGRLATSTDPTGAVTSYSYDAAGRQHTVTDPRGGITTTTYTAAGRTATVTDPAGRVTTNTYDPTTGLLTKVTGPATPADLTPPQTQYTYDADSHKHTETDPTGALTTWTYDAAGNIATQIDPDGVKTVNTWDARGDRLTQSRLATTGVQYSTVSNQYDLDGHLTWTKDANGNITTYGYNPAGNRINETDPLDQGANPAHYTKQWTYDADGHVKTTTDGLGRVTTSSYSPTTGLMATAADPTGRTATYGYDFAGETKSRQYTQGPTTAPATTYTYDADGRSLSATTGADSTTFAYNLGGDMTTAVTPGGRTTSFAYDAAGRRTALTYPDGHSVTYGYNPDGQVASVTPGQAMADSFTGTDGKPVDPSKWGLASATLQSNKAKLALTPTVNQALIFSLSTASADTTARMSYQFADTSNPQTLRLISRLQFGPNFATTTDYEVRITSNSTIAYLAKVGPSGTVTNLASFAVPSDTSVHDVRFQVTGSTIKARVWADGTAEPTTWNASATDTSYSGTGFTAVIDSQTGTATASVLIDNYSQSDPSNPPTPTSSYSYDKASRLTGVALPGSTSRGWTYTNGQLTKYNQTMTGANISDTIGYDTVGRPHTVTNGSATTTYGYDLADQLTSVGVGSATTGYGYDSNGQRTTTTAGGVTLTSTFDKAGELTAINNGTAFTYDAAGRQLTATGPGATSTSTYDTNGRLATLSNTVGSASTSETRSYDPTDELTGVSDTTGTTATNNVMDWDPTAGPSQLLAATTNGSTVDLAGLNGWDTTTTGGVTSPVGTDLYGSVIKTPGTTSLTCGTSYDAYGQPSGTTPATPCLGYTGALTTSGLTYLHARNYNPTTGTFTTTDPAGTGPNPYSYANNNPITNNDPTGLYATNDWNIWGLDLPERPDKPNPTGPVPAGPESTSNFAVLSHMSKEIFTTLKSGNRTPTYGKCGSLDFDLVFAFHFNGCALTDDGSNLYSMESDTYGFGIAGASLNASELLSNVSSPRDLQGASVCLAASVGEVGDVGVEVCFGSAMAGPDIAHLDIQPYLDGSWTVAVGSGLTAGLWLAEGALTSGYTYVQHILTCTDTPSKSTLCSQVISTTLWANPATSLFALLN